MEAAVAAGRRFFSSSFSFFFFIPGKRHSNVIPLMDAPQFVSFKCILNEGGGMARGKAPFSRPFLLRASILASKNASSALSFDRHFYYFNPGDYRREGDREVVWINMVRDPIERMASSFYYLRSEGRWQGAKERPPEVQTITH